MITLIPLDAPPGRRLEESLRRLPRERFRIGGPPGEEGTVVVLGDLLEQVPETPPGLLPGCPAILSGQNRAAAQFAGAAGLIPLDCGLSLRDTLTLSSLTESSAMVSLQRPIVRLDGGAVEPVDLPLALTRPWEPFHLLCCAGALLLAGGAAALGEKGIF